MRVNIMFSLSLFCAFLLSGQHIWMKQAMAYDGPEYRIISATTEYEVRYYSARTVAQVRYRAGQGGFRALFNYISGQNMAAQKIEMTAPVLEGQMLSMTAPVTEIADRNARTMQFFLPRGFETANAPKPTNPAVTLEDVPPAYYAAIIYSGFSSDKNFQKHHKLLKAALLKDGLQIIGAPIKATYDAPYTPPFLRRNEALFRLVWK
jgi:hypothetical protein